MTIPKLFPYPPVQSRNHFIEVRRWLVRNALRHLHQRFGKLGRDLPSRDDLFGWLWDLSRKARNDLPFEKVTRAVEEATDFALAEYDHDAPVYIRARRGGGAGFIELTDAQLLTVRDLSHAEAAKALNVSKSTIQRRRRTFDSVEAELASLAGLNPVTGEIHSGPLSAELDSLLAPTKPVAVTRIPVDLDHAFLPFPDIDETPAVRDYEARFQALAQGFLRDSGRNILDGIDLATDTSAEPTPREDYWTRWERASA